METHRKYTSFRGRLLIIGFGAVGQGTLPLLLRHIDIKPEQITIITAKPDGEAIARELGVEFKVIRITRENYASLYDRHLSRGDFLFNAAFDVGSLDSIDYCQKSGILYYDACIEPWAGGHENTRVPAARRSNYAYRDAALAARGKYPRGPAAMLVHGANPGLVSHLLKQALLNIAADTGVSAQEPGSREGWARLAQTLGVKTIHVAERDSQISPRRKEPGEFVNTWSSEAFAGESLQPAELGWGTHERHLPADALNFEFGCGASIYLNRTGASTRVRTWTPGEGAFIGFLISHSEATSIPDYLTVRGASGQVLYRPTCHYAYHPCDDAVLSMLEFNGKNYRFPPRQRLLRDEISEGMDELGVLIAGHAKNAYWYGSRLTIAAARRLCPYNNATSLQVNAPAMAAVVWAMRNPEAGIMEPDELPFREILELSLPYLGEVTGAYTGWNPLEGRGHLYPEDLDLEDPWQFKNVRVNG
ncbi:MAG: homospermidine synthase [Betaproteobacteria bacterium]|nr:homospermidine synthase [Betaproteobacteria bacterium]